MKKYLCILFSFIFVFIAFSAIAPVFSAKEAECRIITSACKITLNGGRLDSCLYDNREESYALYDGAKIKIEATEPVGGIYIKFDRTPPVWSLSYENKTYKCGEYGFLHEYQSIKADNVKTLSLTFDKEVSFADIYVLSRGDKLPGFVQTWRPAEGRCDIMLLSCHSDDDQLFFAGSIPDAVNRGAEMQVCYFTHHWKTHSRPHELLNGLWECGLDRYPVVGRFPDITRVDSESEMLEIFEENGYTYDEMVSDQVELLRKYKPQIVLVHDINGEYGHGAHRLDSHTLRDAAVVSADASKYPASAKEYGVWEVPKIYIHLYGENKIENEIDVPLERFGGRTAYQVSQDAFLCHISQYDTMFTEWLLGTRENPVTDSRDFPRYSPRYFGLWRSTVGEDKIKKDFYENIILLSDRDTEHTADETTLFEVTTEETTTSPVTEKETTAAETVTETETTAAETVTETETTANTGAETEEPAEDTQTTAEETAAETAKETEPTGTQTESAETTAENTEIISQKENKFPLIPVIICSVLFLAAAFAVITIIRKKIKNK